MTNDSMNEAARFLHEAQRSHRLLAPMPEALKPRSFAEAYRLQALVETLRPAPAAGVKLGMGSARGMRLTGEPGPLVGRIADGRLHRSGAAIRLPAGFTAVAEVEIAIEVGADGRSPASAHLAFEIVASRLADGPAQGWPAFVADDAGCHAVVLGDKLPLDAAAAGAIVLMADGSPVGGPAVGEDAIDPRILFEAFIASADRHGVAIRPGMIVMTGSQTIPFPLVSSTMLKASAGDATVEAAILRDG